LAAVRLRNAESDLEYLLRRRRDNFVSKEVLDQAVAGIDQRRAELADEESALEIRVTHPKTD
jgi:hypothetical protein